jgi:hypothetical protein
VGFSLAGENATQPRREDICGRDRLKFAQGNYYFSGINIFFLMFLMAMRPDEKEN